MLTSEFLDARLALEWLDRDIARAVLASAGATAKDVARNVGVSERSVIRWLAHETRPHGEHAVRLGRLLRDLALTPTRAAV